jgi:predicted metal-dependent peptidase
MLAINQPLTAEQRLSKAAVDIMRKDQYFPLAGVLMIGDRTVDITVPTACTNGKDEKYGRDFIDTLTDAELRFVILHETRHKLYRHLVTWKWIWDESPHLANMAMDYVINQEIVDENKDGFAVMPECGLLDEKYRGMNTPQVYKSLKEDPPEEPDGPGGYSDGPSDGPGGFDTHDWEGAKELTENEQRELAQDIDEAIRQGALLAGKLGTGLDRSITDLLVPQIDWREVLREFISSTCSGNDYSTWRKPNRRFISAGIYLPSGISEKIEGVAIAGDTSGSNFGQREQSVVITEAKSCFDTVKPSWVRMLYWDTKVVGDEKYEHDELDKFAQTTRPVGGGGTDVECVPPYMAENNINPQAVIVITDGYLFGDWGKWSCPVLWVIIDNKDAHPPVGKCVHVTSEELTR